jgi:hypothetical protein
VQRFSRNLLVGGQLGDLDKRHLEWRRGRGSNSLRPGPPSSCPTRSKDVLGP